MKSTKFRPLVSLAGLGGAILTGLVVAALCTVPLPSLFLSPVALTISPTAEAPTKICAGGLVDVIGSTSDATTFAGFAAPSLVTMTNQGSNTVEPLAVQDNVATNPSFFPQLITGPASADKAKPSVIAGAQSQAAKSDVISGLAAGSCTEASTDQWLVGGSTEVGRTSLLFLNNPLEVEALVSLEIFGENGAVDAPGTTNIIVKPRSQRILSLAAFAPNLVEPVVHVTTTGGQVFATMQQTVTRTVTPSGVDFVAPGAPAATMQVITGVALSGQAGQDSEGGQVTNDLAPAIRVLIPGDKDAEITATVIGASGEPIVIKANATAKHSIQLPFVGVADGIYTVVVTANVSVLAAARTIQSPGIAIAPTVAPAPAPSGAPAATVPPPGAGGDFTWNPATSAVAGSALVPVTAGPNPTLTLYNSGSDTVKVALSSGGQLWQEIEVPAGASRIVELAGQPQLVMDNASTIHASVTLRDIGLGAAYPVAPASRLGSAITVFPR